MDDNSKSPEEMRKLIGSSRELRAVRDLIGNLDEERLECVPLIVEERRRYFEKQRQLKAEAERFFADKGTTLDEIVSLFEATQPKAKARKSAPPKAAYRMTGADGREISWSGRGRMPEAFAELVREAGSREVLEKYRVHEDEGE